MYRRTVAVTPSAFDVEEPQLVSVPAPSLLVRIFYGPFDSVTNDSFFCCQFCVGQALKVWMLSPARFTLLLRLWFCWCIRVHVILFSVGCGFAACPALFIPPALAVGAPALPR